MTGRSFGVESDRRVVVPPRVWSQHGFGSAFTENIGTRLGVPGSVQGLGSRSDCRGGLFDSTPANPCPTSGPNLPFFRSLYTGAESPIFGSWVDGGGREYKDGSKERGVKTKRKRKRWEKERITSVTTTTVTLLTDTITMLGLILFDFKDLVKGPEERHKCIR